MANYITWMQNNQPIKGDILQMQGNPVSDTVSPASAAATAVAPEGSHYALVWADVATEVKATNLNKVNDLYQAKSVTIPANYVLEVPNVQVGYTTITLTDA